MSQPSALSPLVPPKARPEVRVRLARFTDIPTLMRLYRSQSGSSRHLYHPFPFDRPRLFLIFAFMVGSHPFLRRIIGSHRVPAAALLVAVVGDRQRPIGYGNVAFERKADPKAIFGYLVDERFRGLGVGTRLHEGMIDHALTLGVRRGGGTVVVANVANVRVLSKLGFVLTRSSVVDSAVPGEENYVSDGDLEEISRRFHARAGPPTSDAGR